MICTEEGRGEIFEYIHDLINLPWQDDTKVIGLKRNDLSIAGAVAYNTWLEESVFMHVAFNSHVVSREMLREVFIYPFVTCRKSRVYGMTPITSHRALVFSRRLGFRPVVETDDFLLQVMTRDECRWVNDSASTNRTTA